MNKTAYIALLAAAAVLIGGAYFLGTRQGKELKEDQIPSATSTESSDRTSAQPSKQGGGDVGFEVDTPVTQALIDLKGTWQDSGDPRFTRQFSLDKSVVEAYVAGENSATKQGTYVIFTGDNAPADSMFPLNPKSLYLTIDIDGGTYHYRVSEISSTKLVLVYLDRGGVATFTKVK